MSNFTKPLRVEVTGESISGRVIVKILEEFNYYVGHINSNQIIRVPEGFMTDFASVPRYLWDIFPPFGKYAKAAVIHDYLYKNHQNFTRKEADDIFLEAMGVLGVNKVIRYTMYKAVRLYGWKSWGRISTWRS